MSRALAPIIYHGRPLNLEPEIQSLPGQRWGVATARKWLQTYGDAILVYEPGDATRYRLRVKITSNRDQQHDTILVEYHPAWGPLDRTTVRAEYLYSQIQLRQAVVPLPVWTSRLDQTTGTAVNDWPATIIERALYDLFTADGGADAFPG